MRAAPATVWVAIGLALAPWSGVPAGGAEDSWPYWGGLGRDFKVEAVELADEWPPESPPALWTRELGEGYSAIAVADGALYTLYREGEREIVVALAAADGAVLWEHGYDSPTEGWTFDRGPGPHATPAVAGSRLFTVGSTAKLHALRRSDGSPLWSYDLLADLDGSFRHRGYAASPLVYDGLVVVPVGGAGKALVAFRQEDGSVAWKGGDDDASYSSPILVEVGGRTQVAAVGASQIFALDPSSGELLWSHPHATRGAFNISTPLWSDDGLLFVSSAYDGGSRLLKLEREGDSTSVEELWFTNQMRIHFGTAIRLGETIYASSGDFGPAPLTAIDVRSGEILWRDRSFAKHSAIYADGKLVLLDEDGVLGLVKVSRDGMEILDRAQVFDGLSWTVPTLVGTTLYLRNREEIVALDLGEQSLPDESPAL